MRTHLLTAAAALLVGAAVGRWTAPTRTTERIVTVTDERTTSLAYAGTVVRVAHWRETYRTAHRRVVWLPDGTVTSDERTAEGETVRDATDARTVALQAGTVERREERQQDRSPAVELPRWSLGAVAGYGYDARRVYGGSAEIRVASGLWAGVQVTNRSAVGTLKWSW